MDPSWPLFPYLTAIPQAHLVLDWVSVESKERARPLTSRVQSDGQWRREFSGYP